MPQRRFASLSVMSKKRHRKKANLSIFELSRRLILATRLSHTVRWRIAHLLQHYPPLLHCFAPPPSASHYCFHPKPQRSLVQRTTLCWQRKAIATEQRFAAEGYTVVLAVRSPCLKKLRCLKKEKEEKYNSSPMFANYQKVLVLAKSVRRFFFIKGSLPSAVVNDLFSRKLICVSFNVAIFKILTFKTFVLIMWTLCSTRSHLKVVFEEPFFIVLNFCVCSNRWKNRSTVKFINVSREVICSKVYKIVLQDTNRETQEEYRSLSR